MSKKILVTGSCGFIFSNFILQGLMKTDYEFYSIDILDKFSRLKNLPVDASNNKRHKLYIGDIRDQHFVNNIFNIVRPDYVIAGAAASHVDNSIKDPTTFITTNVLGTNNLLNAALKIHTPEKFINVSSDEVYGQKLEGSSLESDRLDPRSPYSASKAGADLLGSAFFTTYGLPIITTRCSNIFGSRQDPEKYIPRIIQNILNNTPIPIFAQGLETRDWLYVLAKYDAIMLLLEKGKVGEAYNIGADHEVRNIDLANMICDIMGKGKELITYVEDRKGHDKRYQVNCEKIKKLGWSNNYKFEEALNHTVNWYKLNKNWFFGK